MKKHLRSAALWLAVLLLLSGCAANGASTGTQTQAVSDNAQAAETTSAELKDSLGEHNFGGAVFDIVYSAEQLGAMWPYCAESENGDILNDAVWTRDARVKERFNVDIAYHDKGGTGTNQINAMRDSVLAGDNQYDMCINHTFAGFNAAIAEGILYDFNKIPNLDFDKPWWRQSIRDNIEINGILLAAVSDMIYAYYDVVYFNKEVMDNNGIGYPYDKVKSGGWTWDYVAEITRNVTRDLNGDGKYDDSDVWDWAVDGNLSSMTRLIHSNGMKMAELDADGKPSLAGMQSEKMQTVIEKYYDLVWNDNRSYFPGKNGKADVLTVFKDGHDMMMHTQTLKLPQLRDVTFEFGIVPLPKYDENQDKYLSLASTQMMLVPADIKDPEFIGVLLEALAAGSYKEVVPKLYDVLYENKFLRDEESKEMFEIIKTTLVYDLNWCYGSGNGLTYMIANTVGAKSTDMSSYFAANIDACQKVLDDVYADIIKNYGA